MVLSHALNLVHGTNVHDATLFTILFEVTTSYGLLNESGAFLRSLLLVAFSPISTSSTSSRLSHPAHTTFLLDLRTRWVNGRLPDPAFLSIITEVLSSTQDVDLWTSKAVKKLAHSFCNTNIPLFMRFLCVCWSTATETAALRSKSHRNRSSNLTQLHNQLYKWVTLVVNQFPFATNSGVVLHLTAEDSDAILGFLITCLTSSLAFKAIHNGDTSLGDLQGAIISLTTHWLTGPFPSVYPSDLAFVVDRLGVVTPQTSTYDTLMQGLFSDLDFHNGLQALFGIAEALKSHKLLCLEASMWSCALRHIELPENERHFITIHSADSFNQYRHQLIDIVEDAERRCFGQSVLSLTLTPNKNRKRTGTVVSGEASVNHGWKWEAMVGSWIHGSARQPSVKKRKFEENHWLRSTRLRHHSSRYSLDGRVKTTSRRAKLMVDRPKPTLNKENNVGSADGDTQKGIGQLAPLFRSQTQRRLYSRRHSWVAPSNPECMERNNDLSLEEDSFDDRGTVDIAQTPLVQRPSNFTSLIADALTRRTELHASRVPDVGRDLRCPTDLQEWLGSSPPKSTVGPLRTIFLPSDDSLDLFTHGQTSPVVCRSRW